MRRETWTLLALLVMVSAYAWADGTPVQIPKSDQYQRVMGSAWARKQSITTAGTKETFLSRTTDPVGTTVYAPALFPWNTVYAIKASGGKCIGCWTMTSSMAFGGAVASELSMRLTDSATIGDTPAGTDQGACFEVDDKETIVDVPLYDAVANAAGRRRGMCSTPVIGIGGGLVRVPCTGTTGWHQCTADGFAAGATCTANSEATLRSSGAAMMVLNCDTSATYVSVRLLR